MNIVAFLKRVRSKLPDELFPPDHSETQAEMERFYADRATLVKKMEDKYRNVPLAVCPKCGGAAAYSHDDFGMPMDYVTCVNCGMRTKAAKNPALAVSRWNDLPRQDR